MNFQARLAQLCSHLVARNTNSRDRQILVMSLWYFQEGSTVFPRFLSDSYFDRTSF